MSSEHETAIKHVLSAGQGRETELKNQKGVYIVINEARYERYRQLPPLYQTKKDSPGRKAEDESDIHFDPFTGAVLFPSWYKPGKNLPPSLIPIGSRGNDNSKILRVIKINEYDDIEAAIRSCTHRLRSVGRVRGTEVQNVLTIARHIAYVLNEYTQGRVTKERIPELAAQTETVIAETGYGQARKLNRQAIAAKMRAALEADSIDRPKNDLRTMVMLAKAWTMSHDENIETTFAQSKYEAYLSTLLASRAISRQALFKMQAILSVDLDLQKNFDGRFVSGKELPSQKAPGTVRSVARISRENLKDYQIKTAPYRQAALATKYLFFGSSQFRPKAREDHGYLLQQLLGSEWFAGLDRYPPLPIDGQGLAQGFWSREVVTRGILAAEMIDAALTQGDQCLKSEESYSKMLEEGRVVDIWSAAKQTF